MNTQMSHHQEGMKVLVQCHVSKKGQCEYFPGTIDGIVSALDRDYRINVTMDNGDYIAAAAPECVLVPLTRDNAKQVATVMNISAPEWGAKRFNYLDQPLTEGQFADTVGVGCNSSVLFHSEYKWWVVASYKSN